jgi:hypothetical protein
LPVDLRYIIYLVGSIFVVAWHGHYWDANVGQLCHEQLRIFGGAAVDEIARKQEQIGGITQALEARLYTSGVCGLEMEVRNGCDAYHVASEIAGCYGIHDSLYYTTDMWTYNSRTKTKCQYMNTNVKNAATGSKRYSL